MALDNAGPKGQKQDKVFAVLDSPYAQWRLRCGVVSILHEDLESPPERLLQGIWQYQRLRRDQLQTADGQPVRVLHPGFRNLESGPDFRGAVVQVGGEPPRTGDVEVDLRASGWHTHGHDRNPAFGNVILHVIWEGERPVAGAPPRMMLRPVLDAPLGELSLWLDGESPRTIPEALRGKCGTLWRDFSASQRTELLHQAALVRLRGKAAQFQARARQVGWEQSLWEGLFRALGYKHNVWPMQRLGELRPRWSQPRSTPLELQARLLGLSGLLPVELTRTQRATDDYLRQIWDCWWREQDEFSDCILPHALWRLHGLRPANHPQRRLALATGWAVAGGCVGKLERWCARELPHTALAGSLLEALQVEADPFWSWHWTLRSPRLSKEQPLLGNTRVTDLAVNVVLPWLWMRAVEGRNEGVQHRLQERFFSWPPAEDNAVLRQARQRLLAGAGPHLLSSAAAQQGLIQIVRDFCDHADATCSRCKLPDLLREWHRPLPTD